MHSLVGGSGGMLPQECFWARRWPLPYWRDSSVAVPKTKGCRIDSEGWDTHFNLSCRFDRSMYAIWFIPRCARCVRVATCVKRTVTSAFHACSVPKGWGGRRGGAWSPGSGPKTTIPTLNNALAATTNAENANRQNKHFSSCFNTALPQISQSEFPYLDPNKCPIHLLCNESEVYPVA